MTKLKIKIEKIFIFELTEESSFVMSENTSIKTILYGIVRYNGRARTMESLM